MASMKKKPCGCPYSQQSADRQTYESCERAGHQTLFVGGDKWICDCGTFMTCWHTGRGRKPGELTRHGAVVRPYPTEDELVALFGEMESATESDVATVVAEWVVEFDAYGEVSMTRIHE